MSTRPVLTVHFDEPAARDVGLVGGKCASLGTLIAAGMPVPPGFAVTTQAYDAFIHDSGVQPEIREVLRGLNYEDAQAVATAGRRIRRLILNATFSDNLIAMITASYGGLGMGEVSVRSSTSVEDGSDASFAGQQDTFLYVQGINDVLIAVKRCFASLWTDRAMVYAHERGYDHLEISMAVGVQRMVTADRGVSGVMFTIEPNTGNDRVIAINASYGLGEAIVSGGVTPDSWLVGKATLRDYKPILSRTLGDKQIRCVRATSGTRNEEVPSRDRARFCLTDLQVLELALHGLLIEEHYGRPMDIEWAIDADGFVWILQARPETVKSNRGMLRVYSFIDQPPKDALIATGDPVGNTIAYGTVVRMDRPDPEDMAAFPRGGVLVTDMTTPSWLPAMRRASAILTKKGGRTSHAAIVARELGIPAVVGLGDAFDNLPDNTFVTVSCADGSGQIYEGQHEFQVDVIDPRTLPETRTKIMLNLANPALALDRSLLPHSGVGLLRLELIIADIIGIHPMALLRYPRLNNRHSIATIKRCIKDFATPADYFVQTLAEGIGLIAASFAPYPVIARLSDFKTNEYRALLGGAEFEGHEENPMIGFRGAGRYTDPRYREAFALECQAMKRVRDGMGLTNLCIMIPFIRTEQELIDVLDEMARHGLVRGENGLKIYAMIEVPSNALLAHRISLHVDSFSIGSNDLTQLTLGLDRDSGDPSLVNMFDEMDPAVLMMMEMTLNAAQIAQIPCGICGQGPSDRPELAAWLVERGVTSLSVLPDALLKTIHTVAEVEARLAVEQGR